MPGLVSEVTYTGYGYVDPYVKKIRNEVPLFDKAAHQIEERVPPLISKVDQIAEPTVEKLRPRVEPIYKEGVKKAEEVTKIVKPYYEGGVKRVDKAKEVVHSCYEEGVTCAGEIKADVQQLVRSPASANLQDLKTVSKVNKVMTCMLDKIESLIDRYLPAPPSEKTDTQSNDSYASSHSSLMPRMLSLPSLLMHRLLLTIMLYMPAKEDLKLAKLKEKVPVIISQVKAKVMAKVSPIQKKIQTFIEPKLSQVKAKVMAKVSPIQKKIQTFIEPKLQTVIQTKLFKTCVAATGSAAKMSIAGCEKLLGKEKTQAVLTKIEALIPVSLKKMVTKVEAKAA